MAKVLKLNSSEISGQNILDDIEFDGYRLKSGTIAAYGFENTWKIAIHNGPNFVPTLLATEDYVDGAISDLSIPSIAGLASETFVNNAVSAASRFVDAPSSSVGAPGDQEGDYSTDGTYFYLCTQDFAGTVYNATILGTYSGPFPSISKGSIPQPLAGWVFTYNGNSYTLTGNATSPNGTEWSLPLGTSVSVSSGASATIGPENVTDIWKRIQLSSDTW